MTRGELGEPPAVASCMHGSWPQSPNTGPEKLEERGEGFVYSCTRLKLEVFVAFLLPQVNCPYTFCSCNGGEETLHCKACGRTSPPASPEAPASHPLHDDAVRWCDRALLICAYFTNARIQPQHCAQRCDAVQLQGYSNDLPNFLASSPNDGTTARKRDSREYFHAGVSR